jgi:drug/metabolite transporter (DMT)-like permease
MHDTAFSGSLKTPRRYQVWIALLAVYLIWGSTYLAIRIAIDSFPPFFMAGARFLAAGAVMWTWVVLRKTPAPTLNQWKDAAIVGVCLLFVGNGGVTYAEQFVPSGLTALLVATVPIFLTLFAWLAGMTARPSCSTGLALLIGLAGVCVLAFAGFSDLSSPQAATDWVRGLLVLLFAAVIWAGGSLYARRGDHPDSPVQSIAMQMLTGSAALFLAGFLASEQTRLSFAYLTIRSFWAWVYLVTFGAIVAFSAYIWLVRTCSPSLVGTYAFVNPLVAVLLGWFFLHEPLTLRLAFGAALIVFSVVLIIRPTGKPASGGKRDAGDVAAGISEQD